MKSHIYEKWLKSSVQNSLMVTLQCVRTVPSQSEPRGGDPEHGALLPRAISAFDLGGDPILLHDLQILSSCLGESLCLLWVVPIKLICRQFAASECILFFSSEEP